jgi:hypothetical protein
MSRDDAWIFPDSQDATRLMTRYAAVELCRTLAEAAKLPTGERYGWHSCRRAFANRMRRANTRELQDLGRWKDSKTLLTVYLRPDEDAQREVLERFATSLPATANA